MSDEKKLSTGRSIIAGLVFLLIVLHHDVWNWDSRTLVFGVIPLTLFYHVCISVAAAATWFLATKIAWPEDLDSGSEDANDAGAGGRA